MQIAYNPLTCKDPQQSISLSEANIWTTPKPAVCFPPVIRDIIELEKQGRDTHDYFSTNTGPFENRSFFALRTPEAEN